MSTSPQGVRLGAVGQIRTDERARDFAAGAPDLVEANRDFSNLCATQCNIPNYGEDVMSATSPQVSIGKVPTGIQGFDEITDGGLPRGRTTLVMGGPGCGKTVFALQSLVNGARSAKEAGIFVAFEESTRQIVANAATFGWDLPALAEEEALLPGCAALPGRGEGRRVRPGRHAQAPASQGRGDAREAHRLRRDRRAARSARRPGRGASRDLSHPRLARADRADRDHHAEGRRERSRPALQLPAVHGRLRGRAPASGGRRVGVPQSARHEVPRLGLCGRRVSDHAHDGRHAAHQSRSRPSSSTRSPTSGSRRGFLVSTTCCAAATTAAATSSSPARPEPPSRRCPGCSPPPPASAASAPCT